MFIFFVYSGATYWLFNRVGFRWRVQNLEEGRFWWRSQWGIHTGSPPQHGAWIRKSHCIYDWYSSSWLKTYSISYHLNKFHIHNIWPYQAAKLFSCVNTLYVIVCTVCVYVTGDVMGPTLNNLDKLLRLPFGCGEQNMIHFAPNVFVLKYLQKTRQLTPEVENEATNYLLQGK